MRLSCRAVLFDLHGTLADSSFVFERRWSRWAAAHGLDPVTVVDAAHGRPTGETVARFAPGLDAAAEARALDGDELDYARDMEPVPGARELLGSIPAERWAIATTASRPVAKAYITAIGIPEPRVLVSAGDVPRGKPHPDCFLLAAELLQTPAAQCIVFEDSPSGIAAARAAGMRVVALATTYPRAALGGDAIVPDLRAVRVIEANGELTIEIAR